MKPIEKYYADKEENELRKVFNKLVKSDSVLKNNIDTRALSNRLRFITDLSRQVQLSKKVCRVTIPSLHHFFRIAKEDRFQERKIIG